MRKKTMLVGEVYDPPIKKRKRNSHRTNGKDAGPGKLQKHCGRHGKKRGMPKS